jgi:membrane protein YqaA with SNARE-associated domain
VPLGLAEPRRAYDFMSWAILGSLLGAMAGYALGAFAFDRIEPALAWIGADKTDFTRARELFARRGWIMIVLGSFLPLLSTKGVALAAGLFGYPFTKFVLAILLVRSAQFFLIATGLRYGGPGMQRLLTRRLGLPQDEAQ